MPRGEDYIPRPDGAFAAWAAQLEAQATVFWEQHEIDSDLLAQVKAALFAWNNAYPAHIAARAAAESARATKDEARRALEAAARPLANFVQSLPVTSDAERAEMGLTVPRATASPTGTPTTSPRVSVDTASRLQHTLRLADETTPTRKAKPAGVMGAEVWVALTDADDSNPPPMSAYRYMSLATRDLFTQAYSGAERGKTAWYQLRWRSTRGLVGPWGELTSATVAA